MRISNHSAVPVYTISGSSTARPLPEWLARKRKRSLKTDPEYASRIELLQDFEFEEAGQCVRVSDDGQWVMSTGMEPAYAIPTFTLVRNRPNPTARTDTLTQEHTSPKYIHITFHTCRCLTLDTLSP